MAAQGRIQRLIAEFARRRRLGCCHVAVSAERNGAFVRSPSKDTTMTKPAARFHLPRSRTHAARGFFAAALLSLAFVAPALGCAFKSASSGPATASYVNPDGANARFDESSPDDVEYEEAEGESDEGSRTGPAKVAEQEVANVATTQVGPPVSSAPPSADATGYPSPAPEMSPSANVANSEKKFRNKNAEKRSDGTGAGVGRGRVAMTKSKGDAMAQGAVAVHNSPVVANPSQPVTPVADADFNTEGYDYIAENDYIKVADDPLSTFSIDVDTASYSNIRRFLDGGSKPVVDAVRIEEMINYFSYAYPEPKGADPFSVNTEVASCPWNSQARLVRVGIKGKTIEKSEIPARNLVFLIDVSGSMSDADKLPLLKQSLTMLVGDLRPEDRIGIVVYAGASGTVLEPTADHAAILSALDRLSSGGSTNGGAGIEAAYALAQHSFKKGGINRVILATDGDFNVGTTSQGDLVRLIEQKRESGVFLSVLGFGTGNVKDSTMEMLADKGNGNYAYIDQLAEAHKVLVEQAGATLVTIAKDVKIQVEFNPEQVASYRLVGYENRRLAHADFNDDKKDAGEIGSGHTVTALYEVIPLGRGSTIPSVDPLRYQDNAQPTDKAMSGELMHVKLRYKQPDGAVSKLISMSIVDSERSMEDASVDLRFASSVAMFGMKLRGSKHTQSVSYASVYAMAAGALGKDPKGYRRGFLNMIERAAELSSEPIARNDATHTSTHAMIAK